MDKDKCVLKYCQGRLKYYDGALGYEAMICDNCNAHYTNQGIFPDWKRYEKIVKKGERKG